MRKPTGGDDSGQETIFWPFCFEQLRWAAKGRALELDTRRDLNEFRRCKDWDGCTVNDARAVAGEEEHGFGDVFGLGPFCEIGVGHGFAVGFGVNDAGQDGVSANAGANEIGGLARVGDVDIETREAAGEIRGRIFEGLEFILVTECDRDLSAPLEKDKADRATESAGAAGSENSYSSEFRRHWEFPSVRFPSKRSQAVSHEDERWKAECPAATRLRAESAETGVKSGTARFPPKILNPVKPVMTEQRRTCVWAVLGALALLALTTAGVRAQEEPSTTQKSVTLKGGVTYEDQSSENCEKQNENNPYTGMDPLTCYGVMAPTDSRGECSLGGMQVWKHVDNTCYYCSPISSPPNTIIVPMDQVGAADNQGFRCGVDQADACMAICSGGNTYSPPPGTVVEGGGPGLPPTPVPKQGGPPPNYAPQPGPSPVAGASNPCLPFGPGGYDYCANPAGTQPAGCECSQQKPASVQPTPSQPAPNFNNQLLADAQTILQNAGKISKEMTDAMDVTTHNNVGIGVAVGAYFGAAGKLMGMVAQECKLVAAANAIAAAQKAPILQIADEAAAESGTLAGQAEQTVSQVGKTGGAPTGAPMGTAMPSGATGGTNYQTGMVLKGVAATPGQGELPICGVLSCVRVAQLLQKNIPTIRMLSVGIGPEGLTAPQIATALQKIGINAQVGSGMTNMMNKVRSGNPVIAGIYTTGSAASPLHAVVIEGLETVGDVPGVNIYDPAGWYYWQPIKAFQTYFTGDFVKPL